MSQASLPPASRTTSTRGNLPLAVVLCLVVMAPPALAWAAPFWSQPTPWKQALPAGPALAFSQYAVDLGKVRPADELRATFRFRNTSTVPVTIQELIPSCGCLMPRLDKQVYAPGEAGQINLRMQPANETPGEKEFFCDVVYRDTQTRTDRLTFRLHLPEQRLSVRPPALIVYQLSNQPTTQPLFVHDSRGHQVEILSLRTGSPFVKASLTPPEGFSLEQIQPAQESKEAAQAVSALTPANINPPGKPSLIPIPETEPLPEATAKTNSSRTRSSAGHSDPFLGEETHQPNEKIVYITVVAELPPGRHHALIEIETTDPETRFLKVPVMIQGRSVEDPKDKHQSHGLRK